jgi:hypothetical protein
MVGQVNDQMNDDPPREWRLSPEAQRRLRWRRWSYVGWAMIAAGGLGLIIGRLG